MQIEEFGVDYYIVCTTQGDSHDCYAFDDVGLSRGSGDASRRY
jgi:hypothetical protein